MKLDPMKGLSSLLLPHGAVGWSECVIVAFPGLVTGTEIQDSVFPSSDRYCDPYSNGSYWKSGQ